MVKTATSVKEFKVLQLEITSTSSFPRDGSIIHYLYVKPHVPKIPMPDTSRSLFVANIPIDSTSSHFRSLFSEGLGEGRVERVEFGSDMDSRSLSDIRSEGNSTVAIKGKGGKKRKRREGDSQEVTPNLPELWDRRLQKSGSSAIVVFADTLSMQKTWKSVQKTARARQVLQWGDKSVAQKVPELGFTRYRTRHLLQYPSSLDLQSRIDAFMTALSAKEAAQTSARYRQRTVPDEDGFITVTRGGRDGPAPMEEAQEKLEKLKEKEERKRRDMEASGFYRFQVREAKKREARDLVEKFQNDKRRVGRIAKQRKRQKPD